MVSGLKTELKYDYGICGECEYTIEELVREYPNGSGDLEATGKIIHAGGEIFLVVIPHRTTCQLHTHNHQQNQETDREAGCNGI